MPRQEKLGRSNDKESHSKSNHSPNDMFYYDLKSFPCYVSCSPHCRDSLYLLQLSINGEKPRNRCKKSLKLNPNDILKPCRRTCLFIKWLFHLFYCHEDYFHCCYLHH